MAERPTFRTADLAHDNDCGVNYLPFREDAAPANCSCGAVIRWHEAVLQAIFDPENQPSQYGTMHTEPASHRCPVCGGHHNIGNPCPGQQAQRA